MTAVGVCGTCGGAVYLRRQGAVREARCPCGATTIPREGFASNNALHERAPVDPPDEWAVPTNGRTPWQVV